VEKTVSDRAVIDQLVATLSLARSAEEHKCPSLGTIFFVTETANMTIGILPGHDADFYEFREGGTLFRLSRDAFINSLVAAGINRADIPLDEHPEGEAGPVPPAESKDGRRNPASQRPATIRRSAVAGLCEAGLSVQRSIAFIPTQQGMMVDQTLLSD